jgi:hypothetical protein
MSKVVYSTYRVSAKKYMKKRKERVKLKSQKTKDEEFILNTLGQNPNHKPFS